MFYVRYIDDCFFIWLHGREALEIFKNDFNSINKSIGLTMDASEISAIMLDTAITKVNGKLETKVYRKPTDTFSYLHPKSFHPPHTKNSIIYSQALRYNRICTSQQDREKQTKELKQAFSSLGYKDNIVDQIFYVL